MVTLMKHKKNCLCEECDPVITKIDSFGGISWTREKSLKALFADYNANAAKLFRKKNAFINDLDSTKS